jgi:DNA-binding transcriptional MerR regulator
MNDHPSTRDADEGAYRIGAAARLTGISAHTLRKWEDRYGLVEPRRSAGGERLYSAADVKRLALVKELARGGMSLQRLADLTVADLERLFQQCHGPPLDDVEQGPGVVTLAAVGVALPTLLTQQAGRLRRVRVAASAASIEELAERVAGATVDVLLVEHPLVGPDSGALIRRMLEAARVPAALVVYGFGARRDVEALRGRHIALLRAPADAVEVERLCLGLVASMSESWPARPVARPLAEDTRIPERRWSHGTLARIAGMSTSVACECPRHLADLVMSLSAFEDYSAECENRNDDDAALHHYLRITAATSRALFEDALERVARHDGLELD